MNELRRYERPAEAHPSTAIDEDVDLVPFADSATVLSSSSLSPGSRLLLLGLLRSGSTRVFPGGGVGIEYGSLLKTAVRPDDTAEHVREAAGHLIERNVDLLLVPGMSGYPIGAMYSLAANIPAVLLKKQKLAPDHAREDFAPGSFVIPSYTGEGDVVMSADPEAVRDIVETIVLRQLGSQAEAPRVDIVIKCAGADDIIDKASMAHGITECAPHICHTALETAIDRYRASSGDARGISNRVEVVSWVTPLIKSYNRPQELLKHLFGIEPFAGVAVTRIRLDPPAIGVEGAGLFAFARGVV